MTSPLPVPARDERGFLLVGVVMFMLALTILGLSLFALSSYEAQFFYASQSREQSLQSSQSGMEVVKALLAAPPYQLQSAQLAVGQYGVTRAIAYQWRSSLPNDTTSRGLVNWEDTLVIVVSARVGNEERAVESRFVPMASKNPYLQIVSSAQSIWYNPKLGSPRSMELRGRVWQRAQAVIDTAWTSQVNWPTGRPLDPSQPPVPLANAYIDSHRPGAGLVTAEDLKNSPYWIELDNPLPAPAYYRSPASPKSGDHDPEFADYEFYCDERLELRIHGTVVWVVDQGACFGGTVTVVPDGIDPANPNILILVAKANQRDSRNRDRGIWFKGGLVNDPNTSKVFLVSERDISLTQDNTTVSNLDARAVSIVAGGDVELMGASNGSVFKLEHTAAMDAIADDLVGRGVLPGVSGGSGASFAYARHSWLESRLP